MRRGEPGLGELSLVEFEMPDMMAHNPPCMMEDFAPLSVGIGGGCVECFSPKTGGYPQSVG